MHGRAREEMEVRGERKRREGECADDIKEQMSFVIVPEPDLVLG